ncbi:MULTISPECIES: hypothetical protein [Anoxybacillaceae]|uniref:hypothetical protein n=1 Tax=Anoxybacillaceae TaxID=3120669 RepID=UPI001316D10A|nr:MULTISPECIES: hypothetical protein [Anoxybacillus]MBS2772197.1 hypothetical protein [Anoxybacillus rupiensis]QHC03872.1 hypothetical protein GRQ40_07725 [Anoxybacillus sp. PDR2]
MLENWKHWIKQAADAIEDWFEQEERSFADIAHFIRCHPDTSVTEQTWLGLTYRFYSLHLKHVSFSMEARKKGTNEEHILFLSVCRPLKAPIVYRSYDEQGDLYRVIHVPPLTQQAASRP